jgi:hypothetical protein
MFSTFLKEISGYFDRRFFLSAFFPVLAFAGLSLGMSLSLWGPQTLVELWREQTIELQTTMTVGSLGVILFISYLFHIFQTNLTRLYEGYWDNLPVLSWWGKLRKRYYQRRWDFLEKETEHLAEEITRLESNIPKGETSLQTRERKQKVEELRNQLGVLEREWFLFLPPSRAQVMPTQLGNILRASEIYPLRRYKLDAVVMWPRMQGLLPKEYAESLRDAKANLDLLLVVTTIAGLFSLGWEIGLGILANRWDLFVIASLSWILALLSYSATLHAARSYSELIKASFDLYRWELLKALHLKLPENYEGERKLWDQVNDLLYRNYPPAPEVFHLETEQAKPTSPQQGGFIQRLFTAFTSLFRQSEKPGAKK